jgi:hypothetical protein
MAKKLLGSLDTQASDVGMRRLDLALHRLEVPLDTIHSD